MIITELVTYRGRQVHVSELKPSTDKKVIVECPICKQRREAFYKSVKDDQTCHKCATRRAFRKQIKSGTKYNRLTFIKTDGEESIWKCDCGNIITANPKSVRNGHTKSCGCLQKEHASNLGMQIRNKWIGENHPNWKGGISSERQRFNASKEAKEWREEVFKRDNYTCQKCKQKGGTLNAHHKKQFALFPELRLEIDNGITLCESCHRNEHRLIGKKKNRRFAHGGDGRSIAIVRI